MADMPRTQDQERDPEPDAPELFAPDVTAPPPPPVAAPPPAVTLSGRPTLAPSGPQRWIIPIVAGVVTSLGVQLITAYIGLASAGLLLPVGIGLLAGAYVAGRLARVSSAGGWVTAGVLVFVGQLLVGIVLVNLLFA